ncbi:long-chain-acyl-CoA synthetase [Propylenella binzhouense]|uniref:Long-chain-acyl-CoA synthetase n=1 Tax=Propylenella binzhouense TaxID=2555902 RepID=A0A964WUE9_9HYPH|nr:long-chain-acyl-CoA synthetase [Propylenella binzhouense]MYZ48996.1 long-chain-acyl-CoA synthetase [Propylenella binzhouense]
MGFVQRVASEVAYLNGALRTLSKVTPIAKNKTRTYCDVVEGLAVAHGDKPALISERETLSFRAYDRRANRYARWARAHGIEKGDAVALLMPNRPEYLAVWLGVARAGGVTALLNTNLTGPALAHCVNIVRPKHIIVETSLLDAFGTAECHLDPGPRLWCHGAEAAGWSRIDSLVDGLPDAPLPAGERPALTTDDRCLFIYTSGTTGLPKAANVNHYRVQGIMYAFSAAMAVSSSDRIYVCLPLYHSSGGVLAAGAALTAGGSVFIRERFSSRQFWDDIVDNDCTIFQYIGELCRYLLNSPTHPKETKHRLRLASGNGLRPDIWQAFQTRFRIPKILEWYGATEGNAVLFNFDGRVGSVGRIPKWAERRFLTEVVRFDVEAEQPVRGPDGFCVKCPPGEIGEMISEIVNDPTKPSQRFEGYADAAATGRKIMTDVFRKGDRWFRTGDLMRRDAQGYFYFVDRIGDTFRWKGENVSTSEVAEAVSVFPGVQEANVYGVRVPNTEGRAGMVALVVEGDLDLQAFHTHVCRQLPAYARPVILRIQSEISTTSTFKQRKVDLVKEGFDPAGTPDPLFFLHPGLQAYVPLTPGLYSDIEAGRLKL